MSELVWSRDGKDWPNRDVSSLVQAAGIRWHVQKMGQGPRLLLIHGTGAATHSWRELLPILAQQFAIVAPEIAFLAGWVTGPRPSPLHTDADIEHLVLALAEIWAEIGLAKAA